MAQLRPGAKTQIKVVPQDGELEITLNINISVNGDITATADGANVVEVKEKQESKEPHIIPDFLSGMKLNFGKKDKE